MNLFNLIVIILSIIFVEVKSETVQKAPIYEIDISLPPQERWEAVCKLYATPTLKTSINEYIEKSAKKVPKIALDLIEDIAGDLDGYLGDLGVEMKSLAECFDVDLGILVALNFAYELRQLGPGHPNTTGPTVYTPQACTSIVTKNTEDQIIHSRNLDWNLPNNLRNLTFQCNFVNGSKPLFSGACFAGYVGLLSGLRPGNYGLTINERNLGGDPIVDALIAVIQGNSYPPTHLARYILTNIESHSEALKLLEKSTLVAPVYYILSGTTENEGTVITRNREGPKSVRSLGN